MQITTYSGFSKRENSTKQPTGGTVKTVVLKEECDIYNPIFELSGDDFTINYVNAFGKYYNATPVSIGNGLMRLICQIDPMPSFKGAIGAWNGLIEYSSSSNKLNITDSRNQPTMSLHKQVTPLSWKNSFAFSTPGTFILGYASSQGGGSMGLIQHAAMDWGALTELSYSFFDHNGIGQDIAFQFGGLMNSLVSLIWLPISYSLIPGTVTSNIVIGDNTITLTDNQAKIVNNRKIDIETTAIINLNWPTIPDNTDIRRTYLAKPPYSTATLFLPFVGNVDLSTDIIGWLDGGFQISGAIDVLTGDLVYKLKIGGDDASTYSGNCGTMCEVSAMQRNGLGKVGGMIAMIGGVAGLAAAGMTGGMSIPVAKAAGMAMAGGGLAYANSAQLQTMVGGSNSSAVGIALGTVPKVLIFTAEPAETDLDAFKTNYGMPYYEVDSVSNQSGFVKCADASVSIAAPDEIKRAVNTMMNSGFYYE
jgi:hypothetical protein